MSELLNKVKRKLEENGTDEFDLHDPVSVHAITALYEARQKEIIAETERDKSSLLAKTTKSQKLTKFWTSNVIYESSKETRLEYLFRMPNLLFGCMNAGDNRSVKKLLDEAFLPTCLLRTSALIEPVEGYY